MGDVEFEFFCKAFLRFVTGPQDDIRMDLPPL